MARMRNTSSISLPAKVKGALATIKAGMSQVRKATWGECLDILGQWYFLKPTTEAKIAALEAELSGYRDTIRKIAEQNAQAIANVTMSVQAVSYPPPAPRKLCPPPGKDSKQVAVIKELKALFAENHGIPKLASAQTAMEAELAAMPKT